MKRLICTILLTVLAFTSSEDSKFGQITKLTMKMNRNKDRAVREAEFDKKAIKFLAHIKNNETFICSLTLIHVEYGVTTGDCICDFDLKNMEELHVQLAVHNDEQKGIRKIIKHIYHPELNSPEGSYTANIGIVKIREDFNIKHRLVFFPQLEWLCKYDQNARILTWENTEEKVTKTTYFFVDNVDKESRTFLVAGHEKSDYVEGAPVYNREYLIGIATKIVIRNRLLCESYYPAKDFIKKWINENMVADQLLDK